MSRGTLTEKQRQFIAGYLRTGNATDAYRRSYDASSMKDTTIHVKASQLLANGKLTARIAEVRQELEQRQVLIVQKHLDELERLRELAISQGHCGAAVKAEELRGKVCGFYVERHAVGSVGDFSRHTKDELVEFIKKALADFGLWIGEI